MKTLILAGLLAGLACAEPTSVEQTVVDSKAPADYYEEGPQEPAGEVPPEYNVRTELSVEAGGGFTRIPRGYYAYGQAVVNYTATHGLARATLEIAGYPDAHGVTQNSGYLPRKSGVSAYASREIPDTCGKSSRTEAVGEAWNEYMSLSSVMLWGKKIGSASHTSYLDACPIRPPGGGGGEITDCDWYQVQYSDDGGETWQDNGDPQWLCPGDDPAWATRRGRKLDSSKPVAATAARVVMERRSGEKTEASILFVGTHYLDVYAHVYVHPGAKSGVDAVILVDTMRASADDLEAAILAAAYHVNNEPLNDSQRIVVAKSGLTRAARGRAAQRSSLIVDAIKRSPSRRTVSGRTGRALKTRVTLPLVRSAKDS